MGSTPIRYMGLNTAPFCQLIATDTSSQKQERFLHVAIPLVVAVVANIIAVSSLNTGARCT